MAKLVIKNEQQKEVIHNEIELCAEIVDNILESITNKIRRTYVFTQRKKNIRHFEIMSSLNLNSNSKTWGEDWCNL